MISLDDLIGQPLPKKREERTSSLLDRLFVPSTPEQEASKSQSPQLAAPSSSILDRMIQSSEQQELVQAQQQELVPQQISPKLDSLMVDPEDLEVRKTGIKQILKAAGAGIVKEAFFGVPKIDPKTIDTTSEQIAFNIGKIGGFVVPLLVGGGIVKAGGKALQLTAKGLGLMKEGKVGARALAAINTFSKASPEVAELAKETAQAMAIGGVAGGLIKPEEGESRLGNSMESAILFGGITGGSSVLSKALIKRGIGEAPAKIGGLTATGAGIGALTSEGDIGERLTSGVVSGAILGGVALAGREGNKLLVDLIKKGHDKKVQQALAEGGLKPQLVKAFESLEERIDLQGKNLTKVAEEADSINIVARKFQDVELNVESMTKSAPQLRKNILELKENVRKNSVSFSANKDLLESPFLDLDRVLTQEQKIAVGAQVYARAAAKSGKASSSSIVQLSPEEEMYIAAIKPLTDGLAKLNKLTEKNKFRQDFGLSFMPSEHFKGAEKFGPATRGNVENKVLAARQDSLTSEQIELAVKNPQKFMEDVGLELNASELVHNTINRGLSLFHFNGFVNNTNAMIRNLNKSGIASNKKLASYLQGLQDNVLGKPSPMDEAVFGMLNSLNISRESGIRILNLTNKLQTVGMMGLNLSSPIINVTQTANILLNHGVENLYRGARLAIQKKELFKFLKKEAKLDEEILREDIQSHRIRLNSTIHEDILNKMSDKGLALFSVTESLNRNASFAASIAESLHKNPKLKGLLEDSTNLSKNIKSPEIQEMLTKAVRDTDKIQFNLRNDDIPEAFRGISSKNLFKFLRFPTGQTTLYKEVGKRLYKDMFVEQLPGKAGEDALRIAEYAAMGGILYGAFKTIGLDFSDELLVGPTQIPEIIKLATEMKIPFSTPIPRTIQEVSKAIKDQVELGEAEWGRVGSQLMNYMPYGVAIKRTNDFKEAVQFIYSPQFEETQKAIIKRRKTGIKKEEIPALAEKFPDLFEVKTKAKAVEIAFKRFIFGGREFTKKEEFEFKKLRGEILRLRVIKARVKRAEEEQGAF